MAAASGICRTSRGINGISGNGGNGGRDGDTFEGDPFARVPAATLRCVLATRAAAEERIRHCLPRLCWLLFLCCWPLCVQGGFLDNLFYGKEGKYDRSDGGAQVGTCQAGSSTVGVFTASRTVGRSTPLRQPRH